VGRKIILDCDPGHDDAIAIIMAGLSDDIELLGVTTVAGNSYLENTTRNALIITELAGIDVEVYPGAAKPLVRDQIVAHDIHGYSGLEGADLKEPTKKPSKEDAVHFMAKMIKENENVTIVATGPLTNVALFAKMYPQLIGKVREIVIMGGGIAFGNVTPAAEFNIYADPEAADIVFKLDVPKTLAPLDLTHQAYIQKDDVEKIRQFGSDILNTIADLLEFFMKTYKEVFGIDGAPLHDPTTIAYLIEPDMFEWEDYYIEVELKGKSTYGATVTDIWKVTKKKPNFRVLTKIDRGEFIKLLLKLMGKLKK